MSAQHPIVMVVEDETILIEAISKKLELSQIQAIQCTSVQQAVDYLKSGKALPDAIWLDFYLKDMNGLEFMNIVRENKEWSKVPVIVVSNSASPDKVKHMLALGVKKYLLKAEHRMEDIISDIREFVTQGDNSKESKPIDPTR
jgi:CheY-like chemotaxis protein